MVLLLFGPKAGAMVALVIAITSFFAFLANKDVVTGPTEFDDKGASRQIMWISTCGAATHI